MATAVTTIRSLDHRRRWARWRAPVWFVFGCVVMGATAALVGMAVLLAVARLISFVTGTRLRDAPVWDWAAPTAAVLAALAIVFVAGAFVLHGLLGGGRRLLSALGARAVRRGESPAIDRYVNVVEALCIGLGAAMPQLAVIDDPAPNSLSVRTARDATIVVTTGLLDLLPRDELEAVCAHELAHLDAVDARWVDAASASLHRAGRTGLALTALGALIAAGAFKVEWWSAIGFGVVLAALGYACHRGVGIVEPRIRTDADELADVAAVHLSRNPASLGEACTRLAADDRTVARPVAKAEHSWFKLAEPTGAAAELHARAKRAYAEARVLPPPMPA